MYGRGRRLSIGGAKCNYLLVLDYIGNMGTVLEGRGRQFEGWRPCHQFLSGAPLAAVNRTLYMY